MKTLRLFGMVLLTIVMSVNLSSCSDDDDEKNGSIDNYEQLLIGTWYDSQWNITQTFSGDHSGLYNEEGQADIFHWSVYGNSIVYQFSENDKMIETIEKLTKNELVTSSYDSYDGSYEQTNYKRVK